MNNSKVIGERIKFKATSEVVSIEISPRIPSWQLFVLGAWLLLWAACGIGFLIEAARTEVDVQRYFYIGCLVFWAFFMFRVSRVFFWRLKGMELIDIRPGVMTIRNKIGRYGATQKFNLQHLKKLGIEKYDQANFMQFMDKSFWIMGGDVLEFSYMGKKYAFGKQLDDKQTKILLQLVDKHTRLMLKKKSD
ncbi:MAG: hypothetical protein ACI84C_001737 [Flavobacteriales bacterium]|jgi:hypothetical protein